MYYAINCSYSVFAFFPLHKIFFTTKTTMLRTITVALNTPTKVSERPSKVGILDDNV